MLHRMCCTEHSVPHSWLTILLLTIHRTVGPVTASGVRVNRNPLWVRDRTHPSGSGACIRCPVNLQTSLGKLPDAPRRVQCVCPVPNPRHLGTLTQVSTTGRAHRASGAASGAYLGTQTSSKGDLSKTKFVPVDLRTFSELTSARFTKCAPHLNLKPYLGQATHSMPPLIVRSKEK